MATAESEERTIIASWVSTSLADRVKQEELLERRSVSSVVRLLLEENFAAAAVAEPSAPGVLFLLHSRSGAGREIRDH